MSSRTLSWSQLVREADPDYSRSSLRPWVHDFSSGRRFLERQPIYTFGSFGDLSNDGGLLVLSAETSWPTSPAGLGAGAMWDNGGVVSVVLPTSPNPSAPPVYFGSIDGFHLLGMGGADLPTSPVGLQTGQLWNNGGLVSIAFDLGLANDGGLLWLTLPAGYPLSPTGLAAGQLWNNARLISVIAGGVADPLAPPLFFNVVSASQLLAAGGMNLPTSPSMLPKDQLWNNGGIVTIAGYG